MSSSKKYVCIHGHFYQPPRENAWLEVVEQQESARPYHDWNERINFECYAPNAAARILDKDGWIVKIRNNYKRISWNFGPTLLSWLALNDPETYLLLREGDAESMERYGQHGSGLAQVYSHLIMPLANNRDKITQVYWGVRDFEYRFGRYPEGVWLSETAVDTETLEVLALHGILFTILAPRQVRALRKVGENVWHEADASTLDTRRPYWCNLPSGRRIAIFFYHGGLAQDIAFNGLLNSGKALAQRILATFDKDDSVQLCHVATDGETYGHHHRFGEMALADALNYIEDNGLATLINYGQFLELHPPEYEVKIHENSSWSCAHGVERWRSDCGCNTGGHSGWRQHWRKPLREALDWLRDRLIKVYEKESAHLLRDPWAARNDYINLLLDRSEKSLAAFFSKNAVRSLSAVEKIKALRLLEMQRHAMLMYTSCGWFFDEVSGIETLQILQYALRAMDYAKDVGGIELHNEFKSRIDQIPSNKYVNAGIPYQQRVLSGKVDLRRVGMHFAVMSLFEEKPHELDLFNYVAEPESFDILEAGTQRLAIGRIKIRSKLTLTEKVFSFSVLYLGQQHLIGNISGDMGRPEFEKMSQETKQAFRQAEIGEVIGVQQKYFGPEKFSLNSLFPDQKVKIIRDITSQSLALAEANFRNVFNDNYQLIKALPDSGLQVPESWRNIVHYVLQADLLRFFSNGLDSDIRLLRRIAEDMETWDVGLREDETIGHAVGESIYREIVRVQMEASSLERFQWLNEVLQILKEIGLQPDIWRSQNIFYLLTKGLRKGHWVFLNQDWENAYQTLADLLKVQLPENEKQANGK